MTRAGRTRVWMFSRRPEKLSSCGADVGGQDAFSARAVGGAGGCGRAVGGVGGLVSTSANATRLPFWGGVLGVIATTGDISPEDRSLPRTPHNADHLHLIILRC